MPRYVNTDKSTGQIISLLKPKRTPSGKAPANAFKLGYDARRNPGGKKFVKWRQKLSSLSAEMMSQVAADHECEFFGAPLGSSHGEILVKALYVFSVNGDTRGHENRRARTNGFDAIGIAKSQLAV